MKPPPGISREVWDPIIARLRDAQVREANSIPIAERVTLRLTLSRMIVEQLARIPKDLPHAETAIHSSAVMSRVFVAIDRAELGADDDECHAIRRYLYAVIVGVDADEFMKCIDIELRRLDRDDLRHTLLKELGRA